MLTPYQIASEFEKEFSDAAGQGFPSLMDMEHGATLLLPDTGARVSYTLGLVTMQVHRLGGDKLHSWTLSVRIPDPGEVRVWFYGSLPTDMDVERLRRVAAATGIDMSTLLRNHAVALDSEHASVIRQLAILLAGAVPRAPIEPAKRGEMVPVRHALPKPWGEKPWKNRS